MGKTKTKKVLRVYYKISRKAIRFIIEYIDLSDEPFTELEARLATSKMSGIPVDYISLDWYFYQYDDDVYYRKKYKVITLYTAIIGSGAVVLSCGGYCDIRSHAEYISQYAIGNGVHLSSVSARSPSGFLAVAPPQFSGFATFGWHFFIVFFAF